jgi:hypothetical protein
MKLDEIESLFIKYGKEKEFENCRLHFLSTDALASLKKAHVMVALCSNFTDYESFKDKIENARLKELLESIPINVSRMEEMTLKKIRLKNFESYMKK